MWIKWGRAGPNMKWVDLFISARLESQFSALKSENMEAFSISPC